MTRYNLPDDHPNRLELSQEVHARPPQPLTPPFSASYLVLYTGPGGREPDIAAITELAEQYDVSPPDKRGNHYTAVLGDIRVIWERHTEFTRYTFIHEGKGGVETFDSPPISELPGDWLKSLPGDVIFASHVLMEDSTQDALAVDETVHSMFGDSELAGSIIAEGGAVAITDFKTHDDGFNRFLIKNRSLNPHQAGRYMRGLLEMDTYRMMALLGLPIARDLGRLLTQREQELASITREMAEEIHADESVLLERMSRLEADIEARYSEHYFRFSASEAYYGIVQARINEFREERLEGLQTFAEFTERRLAPAMNTVQAVSYRLESMSKHLARATQLLSTRVALTQEQQSREILETMARRAKLQLRLQQTVEGLSVAAITYYVVGLVSYAAKGSENLGLGLDATIITAVSIPIVGLGIWLGVQRVRKALGKAED